MLFKTGHIKDTLWAIWKIEETKDQLLSMFNNKDALKQHLSIKSEVKILERLAVRALLKQLLNKEIIINYQPSGRPYLKGENTNISVSHTRGYVALALTQKEYVGIDIQSVTDKVKVVRPRFVSDTEYIDPENELLHLLLHWSAKESLYKAMGISGVNLSEGFRIENFHPKSEGIFEASEQLTVDKLRFEISYLTSPEFVFTITSK